jgi:dephospho-CoA kinase
MLQIAITGGIACGKSLVGAFWASQGVAVCEADDVARELMRPGGVLFKPVVQAFGVSVVAADGMLNRKALAELVFTDHKALQRLNAIVHPVAQAHWEAWLKEQAAIAAVIVPLLYEGGYEHGWDAVVCVCAPLEAKKRRLAERGLSVAEAELRMAAQLPDEVKAARADYVLYNGGTRELLRQQATRVLTYIRENGKWT